VSVVLTHASALAVKSQTPSNTRKTACARGQEKCLAKHVCFVGQVCWVHKLNSAQQKYLVDPVADPVPIAGLFSSWFCRKFGFANFHTY